MPWVAINFDTFENQSHHTEAGKILHNCNKLIFFKGVCKQCILSIASNNEIRIGDYRRQLVGNCWRKIGEGLTVSSGSWLLSAALTAATARAMTYHDRGESDARIIGPPSRLIRLNQGWSLTCSRFLDFFFRHWKTSHFCHAFLISQSFGFCCRLFVRFYFWIYFLI